MRSRPFSFPFAALSKFVPVALTTLALTGCAADAGGRPDDGAVASEDALGFSTGPEGLARWLGTNHAIRYLGQYVDTRPGALLPSLVPDDSGIESLQFPASTLASDVVKDVIAVGRKADRDGLAIRVGEPDVDPSFPLVKPGVYVRSQRPVWLTIHLEHALDGTRDVALTDAEGSAAMRALDEATTEVLVVTEDGSAVSLAFGVVTRPLSNAPDAPVNGYWTLLAADLQPIVFFGE